MFARQLQFRVILVEAEHFAHVATRCGVSIVRWASGHGMTPEGEHILAWARRALSDWEAHKQEASSSKALTGALCIGAVPSAIHRLAIRDAEV